MEEIVVYVDESGGFQKNNVTEENSFYVIVGIVIKKSYRNEFETKYLDIIKRYSGSEFLKSNKFLKNIIKLIC